jgi:3-oxoacyl-[acyl-carrier-protein] synthase-3
VLNILGIGYFHPPGEIDNQFIEKLDVGTNEQWIVEKIGILTRRTTLPLEYIKETKNADPRLSRAVATMSPADMATRACEMAIKRAGISASQIGMVICNACAPDETAPVLSQRVSQRLGIEAPGFDVMTACPAFALHIDFVNNFREEELPEYVLCFASAALTQHVNYCDRSDGAIWGDGASAYVLSARHPGKLQVVDTHFSADPTRASAVVVDNYRHFHQDGRAVRDFSVRQTVRLIKRLEEQYQLDWSKDVFIGHQANATMLQQITNNREIPEQSHWHNAESIGNQAASGAPACLGMHWDEIVPGQRIVVAVVGAGLSWGSVLLEAPR